MANISGNLPEQCFGVLKSTNEVILIHRGQMGYSPTREGKLPWYGEELADKLNEDRGVTKAQRAAMEWGSMFGWDTLAADSDMYDEKGNPKREVR